MIVLGIDPGTHFGWSMELGDGLYASGHMQLPTDPALRMSRFSYTIRHYIETYRPNVVAVETVHMKSAAQGKIIHGQLGIVYAMSEEYAYAVLEVPASMWKAKLLGDGRASKEDSLAYLMVGNEHEADAVGVMRYVQQFGVRTCE